MLINKAILRRLVQTPFFTIVTVVTLALGIGANVAIFSVIESVLLKPLPFSKPDELVGLWHSAKGLTAMDLNMCPSLYFTYREQAHSFSGLGVYTGGSVAVSHIAQPEQVKSLFVSSGILPLLGVSPALGRTFTEADDSDGRPPTALLSNSYWESRFQGSRSALGRHIVIDGTDHEIIGVLPATFKFMHPEPEIVLPLQFNRAKAVLGNFSYQGVARLKPGVTLAQANSDLARLIPIWLRSWPAPPGFDKALFENAAIAPKIRLFRDDVVGDIGVILSLIMGTVGLVLLIACANVANLLLVRAEGRQHEFAIRAALGASWKDLATTLLSESLLLGLAGGTLGLALAVAGLRFLRWFGPENLPRLDEIGIDPAVLAFALALSVFSGLFFGLIPVLKYALAKPVSGLRAQSRTASAGRGRLRARNLLVTAQVALALVLLISSGLMIRTVIALSQVQPGFSHPEQIMTLRAFVSERQAKDPVQAMRTIEEIAARMRALGQVQSVSFAGSLTMDGRNSNDVLQTEGRSMASLRTQDVRRFKFVAPGYFHTVGQRFVAGHDMSWADLYNYRPVVVISENLARLYWGSAAAALGRRVREGMNDDWREIVGVVQNDYDDGVQKKAPEVVYWPVLMNQFWGEKMFVRREVSFAVRSSRAGSPAFAEQLRRAVWSIAPDSAVYEVRTLQEIYRSSMARISFTLVMLSIAGGMALILGVIGIFGVISYTVSQRTREIGIRMALGARQHQVSAMFVWDGLRMTMVGVVLGLMAGLALTRLMASLLFGVCANDPVTYAATALVLAGAAVVASYVPSRRAAAVDPNKALHAE